MTGSLRVLGIESSCDESAVAIVERTTSGEARILANLVRSQWEAHRPYGGVVPEIAARAHVEWLDQLAEDALAKAGLPLDRLDGVAATAGPGLIGGVIVGLITGKALALAHDKPFVAINHLEAHALTVRMLTPDLMFPYLLLLVSGGHCQLLRVDGVGRYKQLGTTVDDAIGEAFDKVAKMMGLGFPGGPAVERAARNGNARRFAFPRPMLGRDGCDFSFSGLKTSVRQTFDELRAPNAQDLADMAASFQAAVLDIVVDRVFHALTLFQSEEPDAPRVLVASGGVAANSALRASLQDVCRDCGFQLLIPPPDLCTDNGAMVAWAGIERLALNLANGLDFAPKARWSLDSASDQAKRTA